MIKKFFTMSVIAASLAVAGCSDDDDDPPAPDPMQPVGLDDSVVDVMTADGGFGQLLGLAGAAGLADTLDGGQFTLFAPSDAFIAGLGLTPEQIGVLTSPEKQADLAAVLSYHVVSGLVDANTLTTAISDAASADPSGPFLADTILAGSEAGTFEQLSFANDGTGIQATDSSGGVVAIGGDRLDLGAAAAMPNGIVHQIEGLFLPDGITLESLTTPSTTTPPATAIGGRLAELLGAETDDYTIALKGLADAYGDGTEVNAFNQAAWTLFLPTDATLSGLTAPLTRSQIDGHLHSVAALDETMLTAAIGSSLASASDGTNTATMIEITDDGSGAPLVGGFVVTYIGVVPADAAGEGGGSQVYSIAGVLPETAAPATP